MWKDEDDGVSALVSDVRIGIPVGIVPAPHSWLATLTPEMQLAGCVLETGLLDYLFGSEREQEEAQAWILEEDISWLYSFDNVCGILSIDPFFLRRTLFCRTQEIRNNGRIKKALLRY
jgi:hypothetical protein